MRIPSSIVVGITILLISGALIFLTPNVEVQVKKDFVQKEIPVTVKLLKSKGEIVSVEIQCDPILITEPGVLEQFSCLLINKTTKSIRAAGVRYSVIYESNGREDRLNQLVVVDTFVHPDLSDVKRPIEPDGQIRVMGAGTNVERGAVIKGLELEPAYLEFAEGPAVGTDGESQELITKLREGAERFKKTLRQEYLGRGRSVEAILPRLQESFIGDDQIVWSIQQRSGANAYRKYLRDKYETVGAESIGKILNK